MVMMIIIITVANTSNTDYNDVPSTILETKWKEELNQETGLGRG